MGNTPSKNAPINTSVTAASPAMSSSSSSQTAVLAAEDSEDPSSSGCSALPSSLQQQQKNAIYQQHPPLSTTLGPPTLPLPTSKVAILATATSTATATGTAVSALSASSGSRLDNASLYSATSVSSGALSSSISSLGTSSTSSHSSPNSPTGHTLVPTYATATAATAAVALAAANPSQKSASSKPTKPPAAVDINDLIQRLISVGLTGTSSKRLCLTNSEIIGVCRAARGIFLSQPTLLELGTPVKVVGDIHGQFGDLMRIFQLCGMPPTANYLFLGDYVDRGKQSIETFLLLLCFKIRYPENVFLLRGNHECASVTKVYGFYDECKRRASTKVWKSFVDVFNTLPIAATIGGKIFCVHGGLSPYLNALDEIRSIQRPTDIPEVGLLSDLLWSDPDDSVSDWGPNDRGVSYCFGRSVVNEFCSKFGFDLIARGHMVVEDGYEFFHKRRLVTVFSAPNYCGEFGNWAAVMTVSRDLLCSFELLKPLDTVGVRKALRNARADGLVSKISSTKPTAPSYSQ